MNSLENFMPSRQAALKRIGAVHLSDEARSRNALEGAVSGLSPYITHGFVSLPEVLAGVTVREALDTQHKFFYELGWRKYFRHICPLMRLWWDFLCRTFTVPGPGATGVGVLSPAVWPNFVACAGTVRPLPW